MAEIKKRKTRMYEPWGYREENNYESVEIIHENDIDSFFADTTYNKDDNKIYFSNKDGEVVANLDVSEFVKSDSIIDKVEYNDGILTITFTNGDVITIDLTQLLDENEFKDGLIVDGHQVKVLIDGESERWLTVSEDGVKVSGIQDEIDRLDDRIDDEISRATSAETILDNKINQEIQDRIADVDDEETRAKAAETTLDAKIEQETSDRIADVNEEETRAKAAEQVLATNLANEVTRATQTEGQLNHRIDVTNDELDAEESTRESNDAAINLRITTEINDRVAAVNSEKERAISAETSLSTRIYQEVADRVSAVTTERDRAISAETILQTAISDEAARATAAEEALDERIDEIISGTPIEQLDELIEKLGYKDNDTLQTTNDKEVAFGQWNISNTDENPSGQTIFSVGIGTSAHDRKNALEVRKDGGVYIWVEGEFMNINDLLGQISHEVYDTTNP